MEERLRIARSPRKPVLVGSVGCSICLCPRSELPRNVPLRPGDHPELFQFISRIILLSSIPIMLRFILLILYIMDTMFIKYLIFIWWGPSRFSIYHISQSTNSLLFSPILFDCYWMEIILASVRWQSVAERVGCRQLGTRARGAVSSQCEPSLSVVGTNVWAILRLLIIS